MTASSSEGKNTGNNLTLARLFMHFHVVFLYPNKGVWFGLMDYKVGGKLVAPLGLRSSNQ